MEKKGTENKEEAATDEIRSQVSLSTSFSTTGEKASKFIDTSHFSFQNIRLTPKIIEFNDAFEGKQFSVEILIQNVGKNPATIKIGEPNSFIFQFKKPSRRAIFLSAGCSVRGTVSYTYHKADLVQSSQIPMQVNGQLIYYPIVVKTAHPEIHVEPQKLHFEVINLGASARSMTLTITNKGGIRTKFEVDVGKNPLGLVVHPMRGAIKAKQSTNICVEIMGLTEGEYYQELWVYSTGAPIRIPVLVEVVWPRLQITYPKGTEEITLIDFRPTYIGTQRITSFTLRNFSAETTAYVILAEVNGELEFLKKAKNTIEAFGMFIFGSEEGYLQPFENRILTLRFCPKAEVKHKGWHDKEKANETQHEYIVFVRINRVHCLEWKELAQIEIKPINCTPLEESSSFDFNKSSGNAREDVVDSTPVHKFRPREEILRLCLHGQAIEPEISIQPTSINFGCLNIGEKKDKVLNITNKSIIAVRCNLCKTANIEVTPTEIWLKSEKSEEFLLSLTPQSPGTIRAKIKVEIFAQSDTAFTVNKTIKMIAVYTVKYIYTAKVPLSLPKPKIGLGITPLITDEVGLQKDSITYKDAVKLPYAAVLGLKQGFKPAWMQQEPDQLKNVDNAIVALPNDRPRCFEVWPKDKICRAIFTGFFRYSPPEDPSFTLSPEERNKKENHCSKWMEYIALLRKLRLEKSQLKGIKCHPEYELSCKKHYKLEQSVPESDLEPYNNNLELLKARKRNEHVLKYALVPLSALYLIQISVHPKLINFGLVAASTKAQELVNINNMNPFPICLKFTSGNSAVSVMDDSTFTVQSMSTKSVYVLFETKVSGRYFGFLNYIINGCHEFKISIFAFVTPKILIIKSEDLSIEIGKNDSKDPFQPKSIYLPVANPTQAPIKYLWGFAEDSVFTTEIMQGEIPPRSELLTEILVHWNPKKLFYSEVKFISENGTANLIKLLQPNRKVSANFVEDNVNMRDIPLNLPTKARAVIQNSCYHDVVFVLLSAHIMPGVTVGPEKGIIKCRSSFALEINVQIPVIMKFSFEVVVIVHFTNRISVTVTGNVVPPHIRMKPSEINVRNICEQSFDTFTLCVENLGKTPAEVTLDLQSYPELKVPKDQAKLYLLPKKSSKITLHFEPENAARYILYLPVILNNILGPPTAQRRETEFVSFYISELEDLYGNYGEVFPSKASELKIPCVLINSNVTPGFIKISHLNLDFHVDSNNYSKFKPHFVEISNITNKNVTFCIRNDDLGEMNNSPFNLIPVSPGPVENRLKSIKIELKPAEKFVLKATFEPKKPASYSVEIPVFIRGYNEGFVFNYIRMSGQLKPPRIYPNISEVHFPPLPLGVGSEVTLTITAENYHSPDFIKCTLCHLWEDEDEEYTMLQCITTEWLQEPLITGGDKSKSFHLRVKFESAIPIALRSYILLLDSTGTYTTVLVTAVADNSIITNYAFLTKRTSKYKIIRDNPILQKLKAEEVLHKYPIRKSDIKVLDKVSKAVKKSKSKNSGLFSYDDAHTNLSALTMNMTNNASSLPIDKGPRLVVQMTKSMTRLTELRFFNIHKNEKLTDETTDSIFLYSRKFSFNSSVSMADSQTSVVKPVAKPISTSDVVRPEPEVEENSSKYFPKTCTYVERWIFEVVMRCEQYFSIPKSFQRVREVKPPVKRLLFEEVVEEHITKDFLDFLEEVVDNTRGLPERPNIKASESKILKVCNWRTYFGDILIYLTKKGCLLPHIRPEYLLDYECYSTYTQSQDKFEVFSWNNYDIKNGNSSKNSLDQTAVRNQLEKEYNLQQKSSSFFARESWKKLLFEDLSLSVEVESEKVGDGNLEAEESSKQHLEWTFDLIGKQFEHEIEILDEETFELISTQAWLDIVIQIFRVFVLKKISPRNTIPQVLAVEMSDKVPLESTTLRSIRNYYKKPKENWIMNVDSYSSNIYSYQEKTLLAWLNEHLQLQKDFLWKSEDECFFRGKVLNNFAKDLSDSVALLSVTASHCPYIVSTHLNDIYLKPDTPNKILHNAGKLIQAWRTLEIGLTLETADIVRPNPVYMVMLVAHLYEVLPALHPHFLIYFSTPLNEETSRKITIKNDCESQLYLKPKFFGEHEGYFSVAESSIDLKPSAITNLSVKFKARKIKSVSAVLFLSGSQVSPAFAKCLTFYLEGEPSEIPECERFVFTAPLYKVICSEIPLSPPFPDLTTYEVWYTTKQPDFKNSPDVKTLFSPWSEIWNRKLSRRLFLNKSEIEVFENVPTTLSVTVACFTIEKRFFWLLFRSKTSDFIIQIDIKPKIVEDQAVASAFFSELWTPSATCLCLPETILKPSNCPCLTELRIPMRNENLWDALRTMFFKTLLPHEKPFWNKHFEMDIGLCLILWLLRPDEEEEVLGEFVEVLSTKVNYILTVQPGTDYVTIPPSVEIPGEIAGLALISLTIHFFLDVRENAEVVLPLHISKGAPESFTFKLKMVSENGKEIRNLKVFVQPFESKDGETPSQEESKSINFLCQPFTGEPGKFCKERKDSKSLKIHVSKLKKEEKNLSS